ncbi:armadillo-type protein [Paraphysoderma sedebokerense]|nr:armadillo-type protein [Paraphysoderma sedebokerense]
MSHPISPSSSLSPKSVENRNDLYKLKLLLAKVWAEVTEFDPIPIPDVYLKSLVELLSETDEEVVKFASAGVSNLAVVPENKYPIVTVGGLQPLIQLCESKNFDIQCNAVGCITNLAASDTTKAYVSQSPALSTLLHLADSNTHPLVLRNTTGAILNLTHTTETRLQLLENDGLKTLVELLGRYASLEKEMSGLGVGTVKTGETAPRKFEGIGEESLNEKVEGVDDEIVYYILTSLSNLFVEPLSRSSPFLSTSAILHIFYSILSKNTITYPHQHSFKMKLTMQSALCLRNLASDSTWQSKIMQYNKGRILDILIHNCTILFPSTYGYSSYPFPSSSFSRDKDITEREKELWSGMGQGNVDKGTEREKEVDIVALLAGSTACLRNLSINEEFVRFILPPAPSSTTSPASSIKGSAQDSEPLPTPTPTQPSPKCLLLLTSLTELLKYSIASSPNPSSPYSPRSFEPSRSSSPTPSTQQYSIESQLLLHLFDEIVNHVICILRNLSASSDVFKGLVVRDNIVGIVISVLSSQFMDPLISPTFSPLPEKTVSSAVSSSVSESTSPKSKTLVDSARTHYPTINTRLLPLPIISEILAFLSVLSLHRESKSFLIEIGVLDVLVKVLAVGFTRISQDFNQTSVGGVTPTEGIEVLEGVKEVLVNAGAVIGNLVAGLPSYAVFYPYFPIQSSDGTSTPPTPQIDSKRSMNEFILKFLQSSDWTLKQVGVYCLLQFLESADSHIRNSLNSYPALHSQIQTILSSSSTTPSVSASVSTSANPSPRRPIVPSPERELSSSRQDRTDSSQSQVRSKSRDRSKSEARPTTPSLEFLKDEDELTTGNVDRQGKQKGKANRKRGGSFTPDPYKSRDRKRDRNISVQESEFKIEDHVEANLVDEEDDDTDHEKFGKDSSSPLLQNQSKKKSEAVEKGKEKQKERENEKEKESKHQRIKSRDSVIPGGFGMAPSSPVFSSPPRSPPQSPSRPIIKSLEIEQLQEEKWNDEGGSNYMLEGELVREVKSLAKKVVELFL